MKYKALMLDIDGTIIPYEHHALPSQNVIDAIQKAAQKGVIVCLVTGRAYESTKHILEKLKLHDGVVVTNAGGGIFDIKTAKPLYLRPMESDHVDFCIQLLRKHKIEFWVKNGMHDGAEREAYKDGDSRNEVYMIFAIEEYDSKVVEIVLKQLSKLPNLTSYKTKGKNFQKVGINISHGQATKLHGMEFLVKYYNLKREEVIGVGDSYNDFPLLMASGLKIAMGNALEDLKAIADYVAPTVTNDGVAEVINKFLLSDPA